MKTILTILVLIVFLGTVSSVALAFTTGNPFWIMAAFVNTGLTIKSVEWSARAVAETRKA